MPIIQERNAEMQQLNSADMLSAKDKNICAEWYDNVGGGSFFATITVPLAGVRHNYFPDSFSMSAGVLTVAQAGFYLLNFSVGVSHAGTGEHVFSMRLEEDPATGSFASVLGTESIQTFFTGWGTAYNSALVLAGANYRYRLTVNLNAGSSGSLLQNASKLSVIRLFQTG